jgi:hypothetical protein
VVKATQKPLAVAVIFGMEFVPDPGVLCPAGIANAAGLDFDLQAVLPTLLAFLLKPAPPLGSFRSKPGFFFGFRLGFLYDFVPAFCAETIFADFCKQSAFGTLFAEMEQVHEFHNITF